MHSAQLSCVNIEIKDSMWAGVCNVIMYASAIIIFYPFLNRINLFVERFDNDYVHCCNEALDELERL